MQTFINDHPGFYKATRGIYRRDRAAARPQPPLLHRLFPSLVPAPRRERVTRISNTEIIENNPGRLI